MENINVNMIMRANLLGSSMKNPKLLQEYYDQQEDNMEDYLTRINEHLWRLIKEDPFHVGFIEAV